MGALDELGGIFDTMYGRWENIRKQYKNGNFKSAKKTQEALENAKGILKEIDLLIERNFFHGLEEILSLEDFKQKNPRCDNMVKYSDARLYLRTYIVDIVNELTALYNGDGKKKSRKEKQELKKHLKQHIEELSPKIRTIKNAYTFVKRYETQRRAANP